jgi:hypothetical protein
MPGMSFSRFWRLADQESVEMNGPVAETAAFV